HLFLRHRHGRSLSRSFAELDRIEDQRQEGHRVREGGRGSTAGHHDRAKEELTGFPTQAYGQSRTGGEEESSAHTGQIQTGSAAQAQGFLSVLSLEEKKKFAA